MKSGGRDRSASCRCRHGQSKFAKPVLMPQPREMDRKSAILGFVLNCARSVIVNRAPDWLRMAERDLGLAEVAAASGYHEGAAFHAQQCAEKAVKAWIQQLHGQVRGHSITEMLAQLPASAAAPESLHKAGRELDGVYVTSRYPNGFASGSPDDYFDEGKSRTLIAYAREILEFCRKKMS